MICRGIDMNFVLLVGALLGALSIAMGAFVEHSLRPFITNDTFTLLMTAIKLQQTHAVLISVIGITLFMQLRSRIAKRLAKAAWLFTCGTVLFSFSIYFSTLLNIKSLMVVAPVGGSILLLGWIWLIWAAIKKDQDNPETGTNKDYYYFRKPSK
jgi:uncharacterized membrane protein YgdD (TMEM256/DUF423 family)